MTKASTITFTIFVLVCFGTASSGPRAKGAATLIDGGDKPELSIIAASTVVLDAENQIPTSASISTFGQYKYSLDGSLTALDGQNTQTRQMMKMVLDKATGQLGLTNGQVIIRYANQADGRNLAAEYRLNVISELPSLNRFTVQLSDATDFFVLREQLSSDSRVLATELDVSFAPLRKE